MVLPHAIGGAVPSCCYSKIQPNNREISTISNPNPLMKSPPLITVVVAVYNGANTLQQCIDTVAQQTYANKELIIIDGGSNDGTVELLTENNNKIDYWISEPDQGIYNAWNKALTQVKGEWICFLGADDYLLDAQVLERMASELCQLPSEIRVAYGQVMLLSNEGAPLFSVGEPWSIIKDRFKQVMCIPHQGVMHRRSLFEQNGEFDESFRIAGDYELLLRELKKGDAIFIPDLITTGMRQGGISSDPENTLVTMREFRLAQKMHGQRLPGLIWLAAMVRVYVRLLIWRILGEGVTRKVLDLYRRMMGLPSYWTKT
jgi:glycosyltransferase involved in cell wall biosynthesis